MSPIEIFHVPDRSHAPDRSLEQRMDALGNANRIRSFRASLKREVAACNVDAVELLLEPSEELLTMKVYDLMVSIPKYGRVKVNRILTRHRISPSKTIGGLSERQRGELAGALGR